MLVAAAFALKAPFAAARFRAYPDAIAYVNIARNLAAGAGFTSTLKLSYFDESAVTHCALSDWPPLYPTLAGTAISLGASGAGLQVINALLASIAAGLVFLIAERVFSRRVGLISGAFAAVAPSVFRAGVSAMSDPLGLALALLAVLIAVCARGRPVWWMTAGVVAGLAVLARYPNVVLPAAFIATLVRGRETRSAVACAAGLALVCMPAATAGWIVCGSPLSWVQITHYLTPSWNTLAWQSYGPAQIAALTFPGVAEAWARNILGYGADLFAGPRGLYLLSLGLPLLARRASLSNPARLLLWLAALNFALYALTWSLPPVRGSRFLLLSLCLLLPCCVAGIESLRSSLSVLCRAARAAVYAATLTAYLYGIATAQASRDHEIRPLGPAARAWIASRISPGASIASNNPWAVALSTDHPAALLPRNLNSADLERFVADYHIAAVVRFGPKARTRSTVYSDCTR